MRLLTQKQVTEKTGIHRTKLWEMTRDGQFPQKVTVGGGVRYVESEIDEWILARVADRDEMEAA